MGIIEKYEFKVHNIGRTCFEKQHAPLIIKAIQDIKTVRSRCKIPLNTKCTVFISPQSKYSRRTFKRNYPLASITYKSDKADYIVIDGKSTKNIHEYSWDIKAWKDPKGEYHQETYYSKAPSSATLIELSTFSFSEADKDLIEMFTDDEREVDANKIVFDSSLDMCDGKQMEDSDFKMLDALLSSKDKENFQLGLDLLPQYAYEDSKYKIAFILNKNLRNWGQMQGKKINREVKSLIDSLTRDVPEWSNSGGTRASLKFLMRLATNSDEQMFVDGLMSAFGEIFPEFTTAFKISKL